MQVFRASECPSQELNPETTSLTITLCYHENERIAKLQGENVELENACFNSILLNSHEL